MRGDEPVPEPVEPAEDWPHYKLWNGVKESLRELPKLFKSKVSISGINATEIFTFGAVLSATVEEEVVRTLNETRGLWDPEKKYLDCIFIRRPQTFPDVVLAKIDKTDIIMGIELKSWYILAKEGEPSFRFTVNERVCAKQDLLVVVPWALSNVLSGTPVVFEPYINLAKFVAKYRNYWWQNNRGTNASVVILPPEGDLKPYPPSKDNINDIPEDDTAGNFGRVARIGIMDEYTGRAEKIVLVGITAEKWRRFFKEKNSNNITEGK
ncbi:MAG: hypothetical protein M1351_02210 [Candidatus Thermoplasmatota archaeon]|nr:hypothetical protein [Candidatus Thermoplasmatota archaeon]